MRKQTTRAILAILLMILLVACKAVEPTTVPVSPSPAVSRAEPTVAPTLPTTGATLSPGPLRITVLFDNNVFDPDLNGSWGFAALIEYHGQTLLFDTGGDQTILVSNMQSLGVDAANIQAVVLSHIHGDHINGLPGVIRQGFSGLVYIPPSFPTRWRNTSLYRNRLELINVTPGQELSQGIFTTGEMIDPAVNVPEQALVISTHSGLVIITGCAHPGIVAIVDKARQMFDSPVHLVLGGFHLVEESPENIRRIIAAFQQMGVAQVAPTHCSGEEATSMFAKAYGENFLQAGVGRIFVIP